MTSLISLQETTSSTPIYLMAKASPTQAWLWHRRLSHLNFDYINLLLKKDVVIGLPKLKYVKDQLCSSCEVSKAKRSSFKTKAVPSSKGRLNLLHMDLCGPMRVANINDKYVESLELGKNGSAFVQGEIPAKMEDPRLFTLPCRLRDSKPFDTLADLGSYVNIIPLYLFKKLNIGLLEETDHIFGLADRTKSYPVGIVKDVEVHIGKLKLLNDFYVIDMKKDPETPFVKPENLNKALPSDTVKNPKLITSPVLSARSYPTIDPQCSTQIHSSINAITIQPKQQIDSHNDRTEENEEEKKDSPENTQSTPPNPSISFITKKVLKFNSLFESLGLVPPSPNAELVCTKNEDGDVMFIEIIPRDDNSQGGTKRSAIWEYFTYSRTRSDTRVLTSTSCVA
ncbi:DNA-directed DNA polymerase [Tanacetum coccineum]